MYLSQLKIKASVVLRPKRIYPKVSIGICFVETRYHILYAKNEATIDQRRRKYPQTENGGHNFHLRVDVDARHHGENENKARHNTPMALRAMTEPICSTTNFYTP